MRTTARLLPALLILAAASLAAVSDADAGEGRSLAVPRVAAEADTDTDTDERFIGDLRARERPDARTRQLRRHARFLATGRSYERHGHHHGIVRHDRHAHHDHASRSCRDARVPVRASFPRGHASRDWPVSRRHRATRDHHRDHHDVHRDRVHDDRRIIVLSTGDTHGLCGCHRPDRCVHAKRRLKAGDHDTARHGGRVVLAEPAPCQCRRPDRCAHAKGLSR